MTGTAVKGRFRQRRTTVPPYPAAKKQKRRISFFCAFHSASKLIPKPPVSHAVPYQAKVLLKNIPESHRLDLMRVPAENPIDLGRRWGIQIDTGRYFTAHRDIKISQGILGAERSFARRKGGTSDGNTVLASLLLRLDQNRGGITAFVARKDLGNPARLSSPGSG
jgi:hypothetical protein